MSEGEQPKFVIDLEIERIFQRNRRQRKRRQRTNKSNSQNNQEAPANQAIQVVNLTYLAHNRDRPIRSNTSPNLYGFNPGIDYPAFGENERFDIKPVMLSLLHRKINTRPCLLVPVAHLHIAACLSAYTMRQGHFKEGIVLGHKISNTRLEVNPTKIGVTFQTFKDALVSTPILTTPDWSQPFELMCDVSDVAVGAMLGQMNDKVIHPIYYVSKTLNEAQENYTSTEKELLVIVFAI
ncbi:Retrovirus-related Pol polyprotein from transposon 17.6 [Cucumis melo var. makuwa]|uniref:Retrovirus-related Pol polyprotein from transposon 17.6 n=1 Tax=Cucumis melo var. makuwa TaxID=1194695 RepID=A0A5A7UXZ2_CUCMM|nr:Retrovirus-related Pol polyprotein from transposon 17.6 [Cucumis melo var. makuwa]